MVFLGHDALGLDEALAARLCMLSAAVWWAGFTLIPFLRLRDHAPEARRRRPRAAARCAQSFGQLAATLRDMRRYPVALTFLFAYLFFNDGIQTVIASASVFGAEELGHSQTILIATILMVQFVAFGGALIFGRAAGRFGAKRTILVGLVIWMVIVTAGLFLPAGDVALFLLLGFAIGIVLGGTQALARSYFSLLIPRGKEAEYFSFYHAMDRGTSWFGTARLRPRAAAHRLLPAGAVRADRLLRDRRAAAAQGRHRAGHPRGREHRARRSSETRRASPARVGHATPERGPSSAIRGILRGRPYR